jgi:hypothetical protein
MRPGPGPNAMRFPDLTTLLTSFLLVAIPFPTLGAIYYSIGRHRCEVTGCAMTQCFGVAGGLEV